MSMRDGRWPVELLMPVDTPTTIPGGVVVDWATATGSRVGNSQDETTTVAQTKRGLGGAGVDEERCMVAVVVGGRHVSWI